MTRLLLDEHLSGKVIGEALQERGHDARAISGDKELEGLDDEGVLERATREERVLVTANIVDFVPLIAGLNKAGKSLSYAFLAVANVARATVSGLSTALATCLRVAVRCLGSGARSVLA